MPRVATVQTSFNSGEVSPLVEGRVEEPRYKSALSKCLNYLPLIQGPVTRRPGTYFVASTKDSAKKSRLQAFKFSTTRAYILEFGDSYIRFFRNGAPVLLMGIPYEVFTNYTQDEVFDLKFTQTAEVMYITHPNHPVQKLVNTADTDWTLIIVDLRDGPYLDENLIPDAVATVTGGASPNFNVQWTGTTGLPTFTANDIGRLVRLILGNNVFWGPITAIIDPQTVTVLERFGPAAPIALSTARWRLGAFSIANGYPSCCMFHENRLCLSGVPALPQSVYCSVTGDYENFAPTESPVNIVDSDAVNFAINSEDVNASRWIASDEKGMLIGSSGGEWAVKPAMTSAALTPTSVSAKKSTSHGSANIQPVQIGKATLFLQRAGRKIRELAYFYDVDGYRATDMTKISEHITEGGVLQMAYQREPQPYVWMVRGDGVLLCMGYERELDTLVVSWSRHILGGNLFPGLNAVVESVAVIPTTDESADELWVIVRRTINGATVRYVEFLTQVFSDTTKLQDAFFVDAGLTLDNPLPITDVFSGNPTRVTVIGHGLATGNTVQIDESTGLVADPADVNPLNGIKFKITVIDADTFSLDASDTTGLPDGFGGFARKVVTTVTGLDHLIGETVAILADGAVRPAQTVDGLGQIILPYGAAVIQIGLGYTSDIQTLRSDAGAADGTAMGKTRRINRYGLLLQNSLGLKMGPSFTNLQSITFRKTSDPLGKASSIKSQIYSETIDMDYDFDNTVCIRQDQALPSTILSVFPQFETQDR